MPGCSMLNHEAPTEDADKAAVLFFQRLDKEEYDQIYNDSAKKFKETKTRQSVIESLQEITAYGKTIEYQRKSMPIQAEAKIRLVSPVYMVYFDRMKGELTLTFQDESGEWKLFGFAFKPHPRR